MGNKMKKTLIGILVILTIFLFTSCRTVFGGTNGTGVYLSLGYILWNSILGGILLIIEISLFNNLDLFDSDYNFITIPVFISSLFLFVLPFIYSTHTYGYGTNLFWLKSLISSVFLIISGFIILEVVDDLYDIKVGTFVLFIILVFIEIIALIFTGTPKYYNQYLWSFTHLSVIYVLLTSLIMGYKIADFAFWINKGRQCFTFGILGIISGTASFLPLFLGMSKISWCKFLCIGLGIELLSFLIYYCKNKPKVENEIQFFSMLGKEKESVINSLTFRKSTAYEQTKKAINRAYSLEEISKIMDNWKQYEKSHPACSVCGTEHDKDDVYCRYCDVSLATPYPVCPECGKKINYKEDSSCTECGFDWISFLEYQLNDKNRYKVVDIENAVILPNKLYNPKVNFNEGDYIYGNDTISDYKSRCEIKHKGIIHIKNNYKSPYPYFLYSAKLFNDTHEIYLEKQKKIKYEEERNLREQEELTRRKTEEQRKFKQEHAKRVSEQTGIILD